MIKQEFRNFSAKKYISGYIISVKIYESGQHILLDIDVRRTLFCHTLIILIPIMLIKSRDYYKHFITNTFWKVDNF